MTFSTAFKASEHWCRGVASTGKHELIEFTAQATNSMAAEYERIAKRAFEDPGTAGDEGEENWANILKEWLPSHYHVVTKGRILDIEGTASPQIDVLVLSPNYPQGLITKKTYLAGGVVAAFECKLTLRASHIRDAGRTAKVLGTIATGRSHSGLHDELGGQIPYGVLAHSHVWKGSSAQPLGNISRALSSVDTLVEHPREMIDFLCIADAGTWIAYRKVEMWDFEDPVSSPYVLSTGYAGPPGKTSYASTGTAEISPVGEFLSALLRRLALNNPGLSPISRYFGASGLYGKRSARLREWPTEVLSKQASQLLQDQRPFIALVTL